MSAFKTEYIEQVFRSKGIDRPIPFVAGLNTDSGPVNIYISFLAQVLVEATSCDAQVALNAIQWPNEAGMGDLVVVVPRLRLQQDVSQKALEHFYELAAGLLPLFGQPMADGIHQRVFFDTEILGRVLLPYILTQGSAYGAHPEPLWSEEAPEVSTRGKVIVDFSSPNLGKEFDGNHLRSTIQGSFIASIHAFMGYEVHRLNYLGDWGKHIGILAEGWRRYGSEAAFQASSLSHLLECFTKANELMKLEQAQPSGARQNGQVPGDEHPQGDRDVPQPDPEGSDTVTDGTIHDHGVTVSDAKDTFFKKLEAGDQEALDLWKRFREVCIAQYTELYGRMNVHFDEYSGESDISHDTISEIETVLSQKGVYTESDEAWIIDFKKLDLKHLGTAIVRYRNGTTTYLLREVAAAIERSRKHSFDKMLYVVTSKQETHFMRLLEILKLMDMPELASKLQHVGFGKVTGFVPKDGRSGLLLEDILRECQDAMPNLPDANSDSAIDLDSTNSVELGATALACQDLACGKRSSTFAFSLDGLDSTEGWTGFTLHTWLDRLTSMTQGTTVDVETLKKPETSYDVFTLPAYQEPLRLLLEFPHAIGHASKTLEALGLVTYLYRLTDLLPDLMKEAQPDDNGESHASTQDIVRLALLESIRLVLASGMSALGLSVHTATP